MFKHQDRFINVVIRYFLVRKLRYTFVRANPDIWTTIKEKVPCDMECTDIKGYSNCRTRNGEHRPWRESKNHPKVEKGIAFWFNERILVTGYQLKTNPNVYLPIFQIMKERLNHKLRIEIKLYGKFIVALKRQSIYKKTLLDISKLKHMPTEIIEKNSVFTYDPYLLF